MWLEYGHSLQDRAWITGITISPQLSRGGGEGLMMIFFFVYVEKQSS